MDAGAVPGPQILTRPMVDALLAYPRYPMRHASLEASSAATAQITYLGASFIVSKSEYFPDVQAQNEATVIVVVQRVAGIPLLISVCNTHAAPAAQHVIHPESYTVTVI